MTMLAAIVQASPTPLPAPGAGVFTSPFLLSLLVWVPVVMAVAIAFMPNPRGRYDVLMKQIAFFTNLGLLLVLFIAYNQFENFLPTFQYEEKLAWLPSIGVSYHLGVDGPGLVMLITSGLVGIAFIAIGHLQSEPWLRWWMAAVQSGTLIVGGVWLGRSGVSR